MALSLGLTLGLTSPLSGGGAMVTELVVESGVQVVESGVDVVATIPA